VLTNREVVDINHRSIRPGSLSFDWKAHPIQDTVFNLKDDFATNKYAIKDVWLHSDEGTTYKPYKSNLPAHDIVVLRLKPKRN